MSNLDQSNGGDEHPWSLTDSLKEIAGTLNPLAPPNDDARALEELIGIIATAVLAAEKAGHLALCAKLSDCLDVAQQELSVTVNSRPDLRVAGSR